MLTAHLLFQLNHSRRSASREVGRAMVRAIITWSLHNRLIVLLGTLC